MLQDLFSFFSAYQGHFRLESGLHGDLWLDLDRLFLRPSALQPFAVELAQKLSTYNAAVVCGPLVGGAFLAQMVATELKVEFCYTGRLVLPQAGAPSLVQYHLPAGLREVVKDRDVLVVDDVISAGSAVRGTMAELQANGARTVAVGTLLVLGSLAPSFFADQNIPLESMAALSSGLWAPEECPLCAAGVPLEELGR